MSPRARLFFVVALCCLAAGFAALAVLFAALAGLTAS